LYSTVCGTAVEYDNAGNLTRDHRGCRYVYDYENKITRIFIDENANGVHDAGVDANMVEFTYDALGWRIERTNPSGTALRYYYDDQRVVLRTNVDSGGVESDSRSFVFGNYIDEVLMMCPLGLEFYYAHDHLYSPVVLFNSSGGIDERYEYDAYGKRSMYSGTWAPRTSSPMGNFYAFTGRELDYLDGGNLQIMYYRARYFDPETGRFMQRDPLDYVDGTNLYEYVNSNTLIHVDPDGQEIITIVVGGSVITITAAEAIAAGFGLSLWACMQVDECRDALVKAAEEATSRAKRNIKDAWEWCKRKMKCTSKTKQGLRNAVELACAKGSDGHDYLPRCKGNLSVGENLVRMSIMGGCLSARYSLSKCFSPGDPGWDRHMIHEQNIRNAIAKCVRIIGNEFKKGNQKMTNNSTE